MIAPGTPSGTRPGRAEGEAMGGKSGDAPSIFSV
jgi:hypothetical protein